MADNLPRLQASSPLVDDEGNPTLAFHIWWDKFAAAIEAELGALSEATTANTNALAAQAAAAAAASAAATAQTTANTADTNAATAQTAANSKAKVTRASSAPSSPSTNDIWVDTASAPHVTKVWDGSAWQQEARNLANQDDLGDGTTYGRTLTTRLSSGKPVIDFSEAIHANKNLDNVPDGTRKALATNTVQTSYIINNAVTNPASAYTTGSVTIPNTNTWTDVQSTAITATGAPIDIKAFFFAGHNECSGLTNFANAQYRIVRGSTVIFGPVNVAMYADSGSGLFYGTGGNFAPITDQPAAGSYTYKIQALLNDLSGTAALAPTYRSLNIAELKK